MGKLRNSNCRNDPALAPVKPLLDALDASDRSWWNVAFKKEQGARQLLIHNQYLVSFQLSHHPDQHYEATGNLMSPFAKTNSQTPTFSACFTISYPTSSLGSTAWSNADWFFGSQICRLVGLPIIPRFLLPVGYPEKKVVRCGLLSGAVVRRLGPSSLDLCDRFGQNENGVSVKQK